MVRETSCTRTSCCLSNGRPTASRTFCVISLRISSIEPRKPFKIRSSKLIEGLVEGSGEEVID